MFLAPTPEFKANSVICVRYGFRGFVALSLTLYFLIISWRASILLLFITLFESSI